MNWKHITASILLFSILSATSAFAVVAPPTIQCALYENGELQQKACERIYGNLAEKFDRDLLQVGNCEVRLMHLKLLIKMKSFCMNCFCLKQ